WKASMGSVYSQTEVPRDKLVHELQRKSDLFTTQQLKGKVFFHEGDGCSLRPPGDTGGSLAARGESDGRDLGSPSRTSPGYRLADSCSGDVRGPGGHRHREHAPAERAARVAAAADRHRRRAQGHQPLDLRSTGRVEHAGRVSRPTL